MKKESIYLLYNEKKNDISARLISFKNIPEKEYFYEFIFCLLTPQSNAKKCWEAVEQLKKLEKLDLKSVSLILQSKTRFHNNKSKYIINAVKIWPLVSKNLLLSDKKKLRNWLSETVKGYGLKESGHFLRNIGKSDNKIAVLDRHILRNLQNLGIISEEDTKIKNKKHYLELENKFLNFSKEINIPVDHLDLLFWSQETGEIFK